jgi:hypothetical protein
MLHDESNTATSCLPPVASILQVNIKDSSGAMHPEQSPMVQPPHDVSTPVLADQQNMLASITDAALVPVSDAPQSLREPSSVMSPGCRISNRT